MPVLSTRLLRLATPPLAIFGALALSAGIAPAMAQPSAARADSAPADDSERRICRRSAETGSLVRRRRECRTQAEWDRLAASGRGITQRIQESGNGTLNDLNN
jgi:predicted transglutaminase-like cysteine proteinase